MSQNLTRICHFVLGGILTVQTGLFVASCPAGQINATPLPIAGGPGLGLVNVASIRTEVTNNDDSPGALPDNNAVVLLERFDFAGYIDIPFTVTPTAGVTEYQFSGAVDNNSSSNWSAYNLLLGFGVGAGFTQVGGTGDGLDFDTGPPGGNTTPPTSTVMPILTRLNEDTLVFSGGTQGSSAQQYQFRIDVSDLTSRNGTFTLRQQTVTVPGDYNGNGAVDAADYVSWRNGGPLLNEVDTPGTVNVADYTAWRARFGNTAGSGFGVGTNAAVPEPATLVMVVVAAAAVSFRRRLHAQRVSHLIDE
jgi:hypothetical protein